MQKDLERMLSLIQDIARDGEFPDSCMCDILLNRKNELQEEIARINCLIDFCKNKHKKHIANICITDNIKDIAVSVIKNNTKMLRVTKIVKELRKNGIDINGLVLAKELIKTGVFFVNADGYWSCSL